jgi:lysophospholipase L1-like esterase
LKLKYGHINKPFSFLLFFVSFLLIISCKKEKANYMSSENNIPMDTVAAPKTLDKNNITYLALGDSYTIGESVAKEDRFPMQLAAMLRKDSISISDPDIIAATGWTTGNLLNALNVAPPQKKYSFVTLLIGVNNQYQGRSLDEYNTQFTELLNRAIIYANGVKNHVFVLSIPDYSVTPFARGSDTQKIAREIDQFNQTNKNISLNFGVHYLDITTISREAKDDNTLIAGDGLHPSAKQYNEWDQLLASLVVNEIQ